MRLPWKEPGFEFYTSFLACSLDQDSLLACPSAVLGRALASSPDFAINQVGDFGFQLPDL